MSNGFFCDGINLLMDTLQSVVNALFFWVTLTGSSVPDVRFGIGSYLGCNL
jgi:hypothetical protein